MKSKSLESTTLNLKLLILAATTVSDFRNFEKIANIKYLLKLVELRM